MRRVGSALTAACLLAAAAAAATPLVGGDADANGCIASAGYTYCQPLNKCIRSWESACVELEEETTKGDEKEEDEEEEEEEEEEGGELKKEWSCILYTSTSQRDS